MFFLVVMVVVLDFSLFLVFGLRFDCFVKLIRIRKMIDVKKLFVLCFELRE